MKSFQFIFTALLMSVFFLTACADQSKEDVRNKAVEAVQVPAPTAPASPTAAPTNTSGVKHYTCPNNCAGSGGDGAGTCPVCGTAYVHNQAFHNNSPATTPDITPTTTPTPPAAGAAQNAAGVYHYICSNGCAGGAGGAGNCATCGAALAHNQAYHN